MSKKVLVNIEIQMGLCVSVCMCLLPVAAPSSVCALVVEPVGLLFVAYVAVSSVCSILCAVGSTLLAVYLISHTHAQAHTQETKSVCVTVTHTLLLLPW